MNKSDKLQRLNIFNVSRIIFGCQLHDVKDIARHLQITDDAGVEAVHQFLSQQVEAKTLAMAGDYAYTLVDESRVLFEIEAWNKQRELGKLQSRICHKPCLGCRYRYNKVFCAGHGYHCLADLSPIKYGNAVDLAEAIHRTLPGRDQVIVARGRDYTRRERVDVGDRVIFYERGYDWYCFIGLDVEPDTMSRGGWLCQCRAADSFQVFGKLVACALTTLIEWQHSKATVARI